MQSCIPGASAESYVWAFARRRIDKYGAIESGTFWQTHKAETVKFPRRNARRTQFSVGPLD